MRTYISWKVKIGGMTLMEIAEKNRHGGGPKDAILKVPIAILTLEDRIAERYDGIRDLTVFGVSEETGSPQALGFRNQGEAEQLQREIAGLNDQKAGLIAVLEATLEIFESYGIQPRSMESLDQQLTEVINMPMSIAYKINGLVRRLMDGNRGITLAEIWSNPEIMALETERGRLIISGNQEVSILIAMKNELIALINPEVDAMIEAVRRPGRERNPATVALMQLNEEDVEEEFELNRMESAL
jgi:hypothetical protein